MSVEGEDGAGEGEDGAGEEKERLLLKTGSRIHLEAVAGDQGLVLLSNMAEGDTMALGAPDTAELGWVIVTHHADGEEASHGVVRLFWYCLRREFRVF